MKGIVNFFIKNSIAGNLLMVMILIFGYVGLSNMKSTFFPPTPEKNIKVQIVYPGASPEEIEEGVVLKIEENLKGTTGIERVSSVSSENSATIDVEIVSGYDIDLVKQDVENAVNQINSFPVGMEVPRIFKQENRNFAFSFALSGEVPLKALKQFARKVEEELLSTDIISKVSISGFPSEEIEISFREDDLLKYQITFLEASQAVQRANLDITGGRVKGEKEELLLRARNRKYYASELNNIPVKTTADGSIVRLFQVADLRDQWEDNPNRSFLNSKPSVVVTIQNTDAEDILTITDYVRTYIEEFNEKNEVVQATTIRDGSITLRQRIDLLTKNGVIGFFLVLLALGLFLHWRIAFWVAAAIPISFAGMFIIGGIMGITVNVVSLFGMILVIGILVDDGIVIGENIYSYYEQGMSKEEAASKGTLDVLPAITSAILTTVVAFSTFFFIEGRMGDIFLDMAIVVMVTLLFSLVEGVLILPGHLGHSKALTPKGLQKNVALRAMDNIMLWMRDKLYAPVLRFCIHSWQKTIPIAILIGGLMITLGAIQGGKIKTTFFPFIERDDIQVTLNMPAGTREQITEDWLTHIEKAAWEINEEYKAKREDGLDIIEKIEKKVGPSTYQGKLSIGLLDGETRAVAVLEVTDAIRERAGEIIGAENVSFGVGSVFGKPISVSILGNDLASLQGAVDMLKTELKDIEGLKDVIDNNQKGLREVNITLNQKAKQLGLTLQEVLAQVRQGFFGNEVQRLQRGRDEVRIWVRYATKDRQTIGQLENMRIRFADGREFPLSEIANFEIKRGVVAINHLDGKREIKVEADIANKKVSVSDITTQIKEEIAPKLEAAYPAVQFLYEGQNREQEKTSKSIGKFGLPILLFMFAIIALTFRSISQTVIVFSLIPFGLIGVGWGHYVLGAPISLFSILGVVALVGIMVNDALVFVAAFNRLIEQGLGHTEAIYEAGLSRFRAIVLTSVTTILGLGPLILETSFQAQFLVPMAISVAFGLLVATVITLILLPVLLMLANGYKTLVARLWLGENIDPVEVEPARDGRINLFLVWVVGLVVIMALLYLLSSLF
ncbi:MAG: efflux RND transporter permease subunit [Aureispira sp.]|nr:efflux RND transporter permease subunit [Aureispira sp.]